MTDGSSLLLGLLMLASFVMCVGAFQTLRAQIKAGDTWRTSPALQLSIAICIHGVSAFPAFIAALIAPDKPQMSMVLVLIWTTWGGWLVAKTLVIKITGYLRLALALYGLWAITWFVWRLGGLW